MSAEFGDQHSLLIWLLSWEHVVLDIVSVLHHLYMVGHLS